MTPSMGTITKLVAKEFGIQQDWLFSKRRVREVSRPRQVCFWLAKKYTTNSFPAIGMFYGGKDHTTVLHGVRRIEVLRETDLELRMLTDILDEEFRKAMEGKKRARDIKLEWDRIKPPSPQFMVPEFALDADFSMEAPVKEKVYTHKKKIFVEKAFVHKGVEPPEIIEKRYRVARPVEKPKVRVCTSCGSPVKQKKGQDNRICYSCRTDSYLPNGFEHA